MKNKESKKGEVEAPLNDSLNESQPDSSEEEEPLKKQEDEEKMELEKKLNKEKKAREDFEKAHRIEKEKRKELEEKLAAFQDSDFQEEIPEWRLREKEQERKEILNLALKQIAEEHPFLQSENDPADLNWSKFKETCDRYGGPKSNTLEGLKEEYRGFLRMAGLLEKPAAQSQSSNQVVEDLGIGETTSSLKYKDKQPIIMSRKLTSAEQMAADHYPGGEAAYRKKLAEREILRQK